MTPRTLAERIEAYVAPGPGGCLLWTGPVAGSGRRPALSVREGGRRRTVYVSRYLWEQEHGPVPPGHDLHHECRRIPCVNPAHLRLLGHAEHTALHNREDDPPARRRERGRYGMHVRYHERGGVLRPSCPWCRPRLGLR